MGWSRSEARQSELWEIARDLGVRGDGETPDDPVIRGSRSLTLKSDDKPSTNLSPSAAGLSPSAVAAAQQASLEARLKAGEERRRREAGES
jgi:hypothetical protein